MRLLAEQGAFSAEWTRSVFERVPRHAFAPDTVYVWREGRWRPVRRQDDPGKWTELVFHPRDALVTQVDDGIPPDGEGGGGLAPTSSISCVPAVINMVTSLAPEPGDRTLEIGTGSGYNAAILAERVGARNVVTVEIDQALADEARSRLARAGYKVTVVCGDGERGYAERAPYARLISTASVRRVPHEWLRQMAPGGEIVTPWLPNDCALGLLWLRMREPGVASGWFHGAETFMPVRGQRRERADLAQLWSATRGRATRTVEGYDMDDVDVHGEFALAVLLAGVTVFRQEGGWFLLAEDRTSWARLDGGTAERFGDRDLLGETDAALGWWRSQGPPKLYDFGMTVTSDDHRVWLGEPDNEVAVFRS
ncbi:methyltransferase domain-containing protein [Streptomyces niveus]